MAYRTIGAVLTTVVVFASLPLALLAMERGFGLGAALTVPTCCIAFWFAMYSRRPAQRIGWFVFASINVLLLPLCPWWQRVIEVITVWLQDIIRGSQPTILYSITETVSILAVIILPWIVGCGLGWIAARLIRKHFGAFMVDEENASQKPYQFTVRGMLLAVFLISAQTAWLSTTVMQWQEHENSNQDFLLQQFKRSFTTGSVSLLGEPSIVEDHAMLKMSQNSSGISEYRILAPISRDGMQLWGVWTYLCDENYPGTVSKFGYAEAPSQNALPPHPLPLTEYLPFPTPDIVDGEPVLTTHASIVSAPDVSKLGDTITIVAKTDEHMQCDLIIRPTQAVALPSATSFAPANGVVRWDVTIVPTYTGNKIEYEFQSRAGALYRAKTAGGTIAITPTGG